jgi:hypothetical protein
MFPRPDELAQVLDRLGAAFSGSVCTREMNLKLIVAIILAALTAVAMRK